MVVENSETQEFTEATAFTMLGLPLLESGHSRDLIALSQQLWLHSKVYGPGWKDKDLHHHAVEDQVFFVLSGRLGARVESGEVLEAGPFEGIMMPRGVVHTWWNAGEGYENVVILAIGAGSEAISQSMSTNENFRTGVRRTPRPRTRVPNGKLFTGAVQT